MDKFNLKSYLTENKLTTDSKRLITENIGYSIPSGFTERKVEDYQTNDEDNPDKNILLKVWDAPMEGWDTQHEDTFFLYKTNDNKFYIEVDVPYGGQFEIGKGTYITEDEAMKAIIDEMNEFKKDWDKEEDNEDVLDEAINQLPKEFMTSQNLILDLNPKVKSQIEKLKTDFPKHKINLIDNNKAYPFDTSLHDTYTLTVSGESNNELDNQLELIK